MSVPPPSRGRQSNIMLQVNALTKSFSGKVAVDGVSFAMTSPGVFGLIGTNGAGKTTTIRMILGVMRADSGSATWNGAPISRESLAFGYMPEERGIYMKTGVLEQLVYFGQLRGMTKAAATERAKQLMRRLGVEEYAAMTADKLSKGNQQKVQLIATLIHDPTLIFLDEPFSGLDPVNAELLRDLIGELVAAGKYIVMSSHQMATVEEYCEDLLVLHHGKTVLSGNLREIKAGYGHTNLLVRVEDADRARTGELAAACGLSLLDRRADEDEYRITGDAMAQDFLCALVGEGIFPIAYRIAEPSLHEIFIEKVGSAE